MLRKIFSRKHRQVNNTKIPQHVPFEEKIYVKNELDGFLNPSDKIIMTDYYKHFLY